MNLRRATWIPFDPGHSYTRRYNDYLHSEASEDISGRVLDLGASNSNRQKYESISGSVDEYYSLDIKASPSLDVIGDGRQLPLQSNTIDTVILSAVLEHVPIQDVAPLVNEVERVLTPEGSAIAYVPYIYPTHLAPNDYYRPTYYGLDLLFREAGFDTTVWLGGGFSETLLHVMYTQYTALLSRLNLSLLRRLFFVVHFLFESASNTYALLMDLANKEPEFNEWYIGQLVVAKKR